MPVNRTATGLMTNNSFVNQIDFVVRALISGIYTATLVRVVSVDAPHFVDVLPLVKQLDNNGEGIDQATIYRVPYARIQGGANALIIDPQENDIGVCVFAMRDISGVKETRQEDTPTSRRSYDAADGMYIGGFLNDSPERYVEITNNGIKVVAEKVQVLSGVVEIGESQFQAVIQSERFKSYFDTHTHTGNLGAPTSGPQEPMPDTVLSTEVKTGG